MKKRVISISAIVITLLMLVGMFVIFSMTAHADKPNIQGDATRLFLDKAEFKEGEPINIKAIGSGNDWVGIYRVEAQKNSVRWYYIDNTVWGAEAPGSGNVQDMRKSARYNSGSHPDHGTLPAGDYIIRLLPDGTSDTSLAIAWLDIRILPDEANLPVTPLSANYKLDNDTDGFASGKVTVNLPKERAAKLDVIMFWADEKGKLDGYTPLAKFKVTGDTTVHEMPKGMVIPTGATRLLVYTALPTGSILSEKYVECPLPAGAAMKDPGKPNFQFTVVSDIHIYASEGHLHNKHFKQMLQDTVKTTPGSKGVVVVGDMANSGNELEYKKMMEIYESVPGAPRLYLTLGNHDLYNGSMNEQIDKFLKYAKLPNGTHPDSCHYDFWMEGQHFVFLGNDRLVSGLYTTLTPETLKWLDDTLAEDYNAGRPTYIFLHQSLYNTVSGSLPGQKWNGVYSESEAGFRKVLSKYPNAIMFNGHSHWTLDSDSCMYPSDGNLPNIFNTASCGYLWQSYNIVTGEGLVGSQGYHVSVYDDKVLVSGRQFSSDEWVSNAQFMVEYDGVKPEETTTPETEKPVTPETTVPQTTAPEAPVTPETTVPETTVATTEEKKNGCGSVVSIIAPVAVALGGLILFRKKKE